MNKVVIFSLLIVIFYLYTDRSEAVTLYDCDGTGSVLVTNPSEC